MIGTLEIKCFAARPQMPLPPVFAFKASPSSLRILDVPRKIGEWNITAVKVAASYPDNSIAVVEAVRTGSVWVATFGGCDTSGKVANGIQIIADGIDENGDAVTGYVLGCGDLYVLDRDSTIAADDEKWYVRYCDETPAAPSKGDLVVDNGYVKMYDGANWIVITSDLSSYATKQELNTAIQGVRQDIPTKTSELTNDSGFVDSTALTTALATKQNRLSNAQVSAIDSVVDERQTIVEYDNIPPRAYDIYGVLNQDAIRVDGSQIVSVRIGSGVDTLGGELFMNSPALTDLEIPDSVRAIKSNAFTTSNITALDVPDSVREIEGYAFSLMPHLSSITIGGGIESMGMDVFDGCSSLSDVTFKGKTLVEVQEMENYPWGISNPSIIKTANEATQEWVEGNAQTLARYAQEELAGSSAITLSADSANVYDLSQASSVAITLPTVPEAGSGKAADVVVRLDTGETLPSISFLPQSDVMCPMDGDDSWGTLTANAMNFFSFTSMGSYDGHRVWMVGHYATEYPAAPTP